MSCILTIGGVRITGLVTVGGSVPGGGGGGGGTDSMSQAFGGYVNATPLRLRKSEGAGGGTGTDDIDQLTSWILPFGIALEYIEITSFRTSFVTDPVVGVFVGASGTSAVSVTVDSPTALPTGGSYQVLSLSDTAISSGSIVTARQESGTTLEFCTANLYFRRTTT